MRGRELGDVVDMFLERRVVDQHVEPAERLERRLHCCGAEFRIGDVAGQHDAAAPFRLDGTLRLGGVLLLVEMRDRHIGTLAREQHRDCPPDAGIAAGDERDLVDELFDPL